MRQIKPSQLTFMRTTSFNIHRKCRTIIFYTRFGLVRLKHYLKTELTVFRGAPYMIPGLASQKFIKGAVSSLCTVVGLLMSINSPYALLRKVPIAIRSNKHMIPGLASQI